jgi:LysM repeat protein
LDAFEDRHADNLGTHALTSSLNFVWPVPKVAFMKRFIFAALLAVLAAPSPATADAATDEKLNQLTGKIEDLIASQEAQRKRISELSKEIDNLREQMGKPSGNYADKEDLKRLGEAIKEVDKKRLEDYDKIHKDLLKISNLAASGGSTPGPRPPRPASTEPPTSDKGAAGDKATFEPYVVQPGDTLDAIVQAYKAKNIKITVAQIMKANPGLIPEKMHVGQKITIPAP